MDIPNRIRDHTTLVKNHTWMSHFGCILLRTLVGMLIANGSLPKSAIIILCLLVIITFSYKFLFNQGTWKSYLRTVLAYFTIATVQVVDMPCANAISGTIAIVDALMGLQSRHTATLFLD